jgi:TatD DNase family protein
VRFVDSHLHLDLVEGEGEVRARSSSQILLFCCGVDEKSSEYAVRAAVQGPETVRAFVGTHPSEAEREQNLSWLLKSLKAATGVGEVGLDPKYSEIGPGSIQRKVFTEQLEAAQRANKPVQVHSRGAEQDCLDALDSFGPKSVLMHWFQGDTLLTNLADKGYFISFGPALIYSKKLQGMAARCDPRFVLTESDSPVGYGPLGGVHGSSLIPSVVFKLADLWGLRFEQVREMTAENAFRYLGSAEKG